MSAATYHYVCDSCGALEAREQVRETGEWTCANCGSHTAWEFDDAHRMSAWDHAAHIQKGIGKGGIFRHARRAIHA